MATVLWERRVSGTRDHARGTVSEGAPASTTLEASGIFPGDKDTVFQGQTLTPESWRKVLLAGSMFGTGPYPEPGHRLYFEDQWWTIFSVKRLDPEAYLPILFTVKVRI